MFTVIYITVTHGMFTVIYGILWHQVSRWAEAFWDLQSRWLHWNLPTWSQRWSHKVVFSQKSYRCNYISGCSGCMWHQLYSDCMWHQLYSGCMWH